ncbi:nucleic-acid-binding protein from mobile element jockey [Elysia marginata]|uniref:Nucleic-acid-binding protein from mobile element jockey n=1 Tax=Elysia marginata TaxID=1093978 RepID=A0AAV4H246_9GAST|nr:nucleic-acid-binding protein from mobile element jockey [Elysia marginata]
MEIRRGGEKIRTNTFVLTFDSPPPPAEIKVGYLDLKVRPFVPTLMRCLKCHRYGHGGEKCRRPAAICARCGRTGHKVEECPNDPRCINCRGVMWPVIGNAQSTRRKTQYYITVPIMEACSSRPVRQLSWRWQGKYRLDPLPQCKLIEAARASILTYKTNKNLTRVPWFNKDCKTAIKDRKKAQRKFFNNPNLQTLIKF